MTLNDINKKYNDDTYPLYPFIAKNRVTPLKAGLYRKHKASFRGITAVFNAEKEEYEFPLYGMFNVPEDIIVVPEGLELNESKQNVLDAHVKAGFKAVPKPPEFTPILFAQDSEEANLALANKAQFQYSEQEVGGVVDIKIVPGV